MPPKEEKGFKGNGEDTLQLQELYELMESEQLDSLELKDDDVTIRLVRRRHVALAAPLPVPSRAAAPAETPVASTDTSATSGPSIPSPLAGVFYRASSPTTPPFVKEGDVVSAGQTLCIVEAMKVMNEIKAEAACRIVKIVAENSRPVSAGQALFLVGPA